MKLPRVRIQSLPPYTAESPPTTPTGRNTPTIHTVEVGYAEADRPTVYRAMVEALIYNLTFIQGGATSLAHCHDLGMVRNTGRALWSWSSIPSPFFEEGISQMQRAALRSTALFEEDMRVLSPRFACLLLMTSFSNIERDMERAAELVGHPLRTRASLAFSLSCLDYGTPPLRPFARLEPLPQRAGYNAVQSAVLALADAGELPFSHYLLTRGIYEADQAKRIAENESAVQGDLITLAEFIAPRLADVQELVELLMLLPAGTYAKAADKVMTGQWKELRLGEEPGDPDDDLLALVCRALIRRLGCGGREQLLGAEHLLALSLLTGVSPAAFAHHAIADFRRRGTTYVTAAGLDELAYMVSTLQVGGVRESARRDVLVKELVSLADELDAAHAGMKDWEGELPQKMLKAYAPKALAFEWTARSQTEPSDMDE